MEFWRKTPPLHEVSSPDLVNKRVSTIQSIQRQAAPLLYQLGNGPANLRTAEGVEAVIERGIAMTEIARFMQGLALVQAFPRSQRFIRLDNPSPYPVELPEGSFPLPDRYISDAIERGKEKGIMTVLPLLEANFTPHHENANVPLMRWTRGMAERYFEQVLASDEFDVYRLPTIIPESTIEFTYLAGETRPTLDLILEPLR